MAALTLTKPIKDAVSGKSYYTQKMNVKNFGAGHRIQSIELYGTLLAGTVSGNLSSFFIRKAHSGGQSFLQFKNVVVDFESCCGSHWKFRSQLEASPT